MTWSNLIWSVINHKLYPFTEVYINFCLVACCSFICAKLQFIYLAIFFQMKLNILMIIKKKKSKKNQGTPRSTYTHIEAITTAEKQGLLYCVLLIADLMQQLTNLFLTYWLITPILTQFCNSQAANQICELLGISEKMFFSVPRELENA